MAVADVPSEPAVMASLKQAWTNIWPHFWWLLLFGLIAGIANGIEGGAQAPLAEQVFLDLFGGLVAIFLGIPLSMGVVKAHVAASRGQKPTWSDLGVCFGPRYWQAVGTGILVVLITLAGFILLVIPGIYWGVKMSFTAQRFLEDDLSFMAAIKASFADVTGRWWNVFGMWLMSIPLIIAGALALGVGVFVSIVLIYQMSTVYWRSIVQ